MNYSLIFKYLYQSTKMIIFKNSFLNKNIIQILLKKNNFYFSVLHLKLSTFFYTSQLIDVFSYENSTSLNKKNLIIDFNNSLSNSTIVYNFHVTKNNWRIFFFVITQGSTKKTNVISKTLHLSSITELFNNANWLEREAFELSNIFFYGKKDIRNLMLQYGDSSSPFKKNYPCVGLKEYFYDANADSIITVPTSLQF